MFINVHLFQRLKMPHSHIKKKNKMKWRSYSCYKKTTIKKTSTKTHGTTTQCVLLHWSLTSQVKVGNRVSVHGIQPPLTYNFETQSLWKGHPFACWSSMTNIYKYHYGNLGCIRVFMAWYILCWLPWSMLQYISRLSWKWGGIYVRMSYSFISQVVSSKRIYNDGCDDTNLTASSA